MSFFNPIKKMFDGLKLSAADLKNKVFSEKSKVDSSIKDDVSDNDSSNQNNSSSQNDESFASQQANNDSPSFEIEEEKNDVIILPYVPHAKPINNTTSDNVTCESGNSKHNDDIPHSVKSPKLQKAAEDNSAVIFPKKIDDTIILPYVPHERISNTITSESINLSKDTSNLNKDIHHNIKHPQSQQKTKGKSITTGTKPKKDTVALPHIPHKKPIKNNTSESEISSTTKPISLDSTIHSEKHSRLQLNPKEDNRSVNERSNTSNGNTSQKYNKDDNNPQDLNKQSQKSSLQSYKLVKEFSIKSNAQIYSKRLENVVIKKTKTGKWHVLQLAGGINEKDRQSKDPHVRINNSANQVKESSTLEKITLPNTKNEELHNLSTRSEDRALSSTTRSQSTGVREVETSNVSTVVNLDIRSEKNRNKPTERTIPKSEKVYFCYNLLEPLKKVFKVNISKWVAKKRISSISQFMRSDMNEVARFFQLDNLIELIDEEYRSNITFSNENTIEYHNYIMTDHFDFGLAKEADKVLQPYHPEQNTEKFENKLNDKEHKNKSINTSNLATSSGNNFKEKEKLEEEQLESDKFQDKSWLLDNKTRPKDTQLSTLTNGDSVEKSNVSNEAINYSEEKISNVKNVQIIEEKATIEENNLLEQSSVETVLDSDVIIRKFHFYLSAKIYKSKHDNITIKKINDDLWAVVTSKSIENRDLKHIEKVYFGYNLNEPVKNVFAVPISAWVVEKKISSVSAFMVTNMNEVAEYFQLDNLTDLINEQYRKSVTFTDKNEIEYHNYKMEDHFDVVFDEKNTEYSLVTHNILQEFSTFSESQSVKTETNFIKPVQIEIEEQSINHIKDHSELIEKVHSLKKKDEPVDQYIKTTECNQTRNFSTDSQLYLPKSSSKNNEKVYFSFNFNTSIKRVFTVPISNWVIKKQLSSVKDFMQSDMNEVLPFFQLEKFIDLIDLEFQSDAKFTYFISNDSYNYDIKDHFNLPLEDTTAINSYEEQLSTSTNISEEVSKLEVGLTDEEIRPSFNSDQPKVAKLCDDPQSTRELTAQDLDLSLPLTNNKHLLALTHTLGLKTYKDLIEFDLNELKNYKGYGKTRIKNVIQSLKEWHLNYDGFTYYWADNTPDTKEASDENILSRKLTPEELKLALPRINNKYLLAFSDRFKLKTYRDLVNFDLNELNKYKGYGDIKIQKIIQSLQEWHIHFDGENYSCFETIKSAIVIDTNDSYVMQRLQVPLQQIISSQKFDKLNEKFKLKYLGDVHNLELSKLYAIKKIGIKKVSDFIEILHENLSLVCENQILKITKLPKLQQYIHCNFNTPIKEIFAVDISKWIAYMKVSTFKNFLALDMNLALNYFELDHLNDLIKPTYHKDICFSELKMDFNSEKDIEFSNHFTLDFEQFLETSFKLFDKVSHKNQMIAFARYSDLTAITSLQQVGLEFGVTRERIRQIIKKVQSSWQYHFSAGYISVYYKFIEIHCAPTDELCLDSEIWDKYQDKLGLLRLLFDKSLYFNQLSKSISIISNEEKQQRLKQLVTKISNVIIQNFKELGPIKNIHDIRLQALSTSQKNDLFVYIEHTYYPSANHFDKSFCLRYYLLSNYPDGFQLPSDVENIKRLYDNIYGEAELTDRAFTGRVLHQALTIYHIWARGTYIDDIYLPQFEVCDLSILVTSIEKELQKLSQFGINTLYEKHDDILHKYNIINQYQFYSILRKSINGTSFELPKFPTIVKKGTSKKLITNEILDYVLENGPILKKSVYTEFIENRGYVATTVQMFLGSCVDIVNVSKHQITHMDNCIISEYCEEKLNAILTESLSSKKEVEVADLYQANIASLAGLHIANEYQLASYIKYFCPAYEITGTRVSKEKVKSYKEIYLSFCNQLTMPISKTKFQAYFRDLGWGKRQLTGYRATNKNLISLDQYYLPKAIVNITDNNLLQLERYIDYQLTLYDYLPIYHIVTFMKDSSITLKNNLDVYPAVVAYLIQTHIPRLTLLTSSTHKVMAITKDKSFNFLTILVSFLIDENINLNDNDEVSSFLLKFGYIHTQLSYPQHEKVILAQNNYQCFQHPIKQLNIHLDIERALNIDDDEETLDDEIDFNEYFSI